MLITYVHTKGQKPTPEQLKEIREAAKHEIQFDEDCLELSPGMLEKLKAAAIERSRRKAAEKLAQSGS